MKRARSCKPIGNAPEIVPVYEPEVGKPINGYMTRGHRPSDSAFDPTTDIAIRVFDAYSYGVIITVETLDRPAEIFYEANCHPDYFLEYVIGERQKEGFVSNNGKLFFGGFRKRNRVKAIRVTWESVYAKIERIARAEYEMDLNNPERTKPMMWDLADYMSHNDWGNHGKGYIPVGIENLDCINVKTSPVILNDSLVKVMEHLETLIVK